MRQKVTLWHTCAKNVSVLCICSSAHLFFAARRRGHPLEIFIRTYSHPVNFVGQWSCSGVAGFFGVDSFDDFYRANPGKVGGTFSKKSPTLNTPPPWRMSLKMEITIRRECLLLQIYFFICLPVHFLFVALAYFSSRMGNHQQSCPRVVALHKRAITSVSLRKWYTKAVLRFGDNSFVFSAGKKYTCEFSLEQIV